MKMLLRKDQSEISKSETILMFFTALARLVAELMGQVAMTTPGLGAWL